MSEEKILLQMMNEKIDRLVDLNEKQNEKLGDHDIKLAEYNASLNEHMRRTELLELSMEEHKGQSQKNHDQLHREIAPLLEKETFKRQMKKYIMGAGAVAGSIYAILKLLEVL